MRLWTLHPCLLDRVGLVAQWREGLLAQKVLLGKTRGYKHHPQLARFKSSGHPLGFIASFLRETQIEATARGYKFDAAKIINKRTTKTVGVTSGQVSYEWNHLSAKIRNRDHDWLEHLSERFDLSNPAEFPVCTIFRIIDGPVEPWERV